eukprot:6970333-Heterocapsa_arctica.AAC.1
MWSPDNVNFKENGPLKGKDHNVRIELRLELCSLHWNNSQAKLRLSQNQYVRDTTNYLLSGGIVRNGKHSDLWRRIKENIWKLICIGWVKAHLKQEKATAAGVSYEDWHGNNQADEQAKAGAEKHGYTKRQTFAIEQNASLVARIQHHMITQTYI